MTEAEKEWGLLTWQEKRQRRFARWLKPAEVKFDSPAAEQLYQQRVGRFIDAICLREGDRVPVILPVGTYPAYHAGTTLKAMIYDYEELRRVWYKFIGDFELDTFHGPALIHPGKVLEMVDIKTLKWPGHGLGDSVSIAQFVEGENMTANEYEDFINDPLDFYLRCYLPRTWGVFAPFRKIGRHLSTHDVAYQILGFASDPEFVAAFDTLRRAGEEHRKWRAVVMEISNRILGMGIPPIRGQMTSAPFDNIGDLLRGTREIAMDMYRRPDDIHRAMDKLAPLLVKRVLSQADASICPLVFMPLHKGDDAFMSDQQFRTFYWPSFRWVMMQLIEEGMTPFLFAEGKYNNRLEVIRDLPKGSVIWHFDQTDMFRAKEVLGDVACIAGNIPASLLCTGAPEMVRENCIQLIERCGKGGGYILTGGASIDKGNPDNLRAMTEAAKECGARPSRATLATA
ncbi:MAG TPA: uroporphyrinogen decarboxylase family protein [Gammaproteobacteria bacterium]|nr:uroporphyrinogen decarboxylase family protein [Gammaproteobacteria bacterium]